MPANTDTFASVQEIAGRIKSGEALPLPQEPGGQVIDPEIPTRVVEYPIGPDRIRWPRRSPGQPEAGDVERVRDEEVQTVVVGPARDGSTGYRILSVHHGLRYAALDAHDLIVATLWATRRDSRDRSRLAEAVRARGLRWPGDPDQRSEELAPPRGERPTSRRAAIGIGPVQEPWWVWGSHGLRSEAQVVLTSDAQAAVPAGYREVRRCELLPVSASEIAAARARWSFPLPRPGRPTNAQGSMSEPSAVHDEQSATSDEYVAERVRSARKDPSSDWYAWVSPVGWVADEASTAWVAAGEGAVTTRHNDITLRSCQGGWLAFVGLGSLMEPVRTGGRQSGCRFEEREQARAAAIERIKALRREAIAALESKLDGWAEEAILARLRPSATLVTLSGWRGLSNVIRVHEPEPGLASNSSYAVPVVEEIEDPLVPLYPSRVEQHDLDGRGARDCTVFGLPIVEDRGHREFWSAVTDVPCPVCERGRLAWAEAGYVPGYRICDADGCHQHFLAHGDADAPSVILIDGHRGWPYSPQDDSDS